LPPTPCAPFVDGQQIIGTTSFDVLISEETETTTYFPSAPYTIARTMMGYSGLFVRWKDYEN
jgi:hypothetical protein